MRKIIVLLLVAAVFGLSGCGGFMGDGRMENWKAVEEKKEETKQKFLETKKTELQTQKDKTLQKPTMKLTAYGPDGKVVSIAEMDLQPVIAEITGKKNDDTYGVDLSPTQVPRGEIAENLDAAGNLIQKTGNTPAAVAGTTGYFVAKVAQGATGNIDIKADTVEINDSLNKVENHATGQGNTIPYSGTMPAAEPVIVKPEVVVVK